MTAVHIAGLMLAYFTLYSHFSEFVITETNDGLSLDPNLDDGKNILSIS